jgi:hypothetical protein
LTPQPGWKIVPFVLELAYFYNENSISNKYSVKDNLKHLITPTSLVKLKDLAIFSVPTTQLIKHEDWTETSMFLEGLLT